MLVRCIVNNIKDTYHIYAMINFGAFENWIQRQSQKHKKFALYTCTIDVSTFAIGYGEIISIIDSEKILNKPFDLHLDGIFSIVEVEHLCLLGC